MARIYCLLLSLMLSSVSYAVVVDYRGLNIVDDCVAEAQLPALRLLSVSKALSQIDGKYAGKLESIEES